MGVHGARGLELTGAPGALDGWVDAGTGVLGRRRRHVPADRVRHRRGRVDLARRADRHPQRPVRQRRVCRPEDSGRDERFPEHALRDLVRGRRVQAPGVHRCPQRGRDGIEGTGGRRACVESADGRARLDVSHRAPARRGRSRNLARRLLAQRQRCQYLDLLHHRRGARHSIHAARLRPQRLLWHGQTWRQPLLGLDRGGRCDDRGADVALPGRPSRPVGPRHAGAADPVRRGAGRRDDSGRRRHDEVSGALHLQPGDRRADLRDRGTAGPTRRHARGVLLADPAVPGEAAALRADQFYDGRHRDGDAGAHGRVPRAVDGVRRWAQPRPLHTAVPGGRARVSLDRGRDGVHRRDLRSRSGVLHHQLRGHRTHQHARKRG